MYNCGATELQVHDDSAVFLGNTGRGRLPCQMAAVCPVCKSASAWANCYVGQQAAGS